MNDGKADPFNRVVGGRAAIVEDRARTTRDRLYGEADWNGRRFMIVDTGGLEVDPQDPSRLRLFAGCGIVAGSQPLHELAESNAKLVPMRDALQG